MESSNEGETREAADRDGLADVRGVVTERRAGELLAPTPSLPRVPRARDPVSKRARPRAALDVFDADDVVPRLGTKREHDLTSADPHSRAVGPHGLDVRTRCHLGDFGFCHSRPDV